MKRLNDTDGRMTLIYRIMRADKLASRPNAPYSPVRTALRRAANKTRKSMQNA